jgi:hypothetical protein
MLSVSAVPGAKGVVGVNTMVPPLPASQLPGTVGLKVGSGELCASGAEKTTCTGAAPFTWVLPLPGEADITCSGGAGAGEGRWLAGWAAGGVLAAGVDSAAAE